MKQYKTYKDSGVEWIGDIPEHWKSQDLRYSIDVLTDFTSNGSFASLAKNVNYLESGYSRLVRLTDLRVDLNNEGIYVDENAHNFLKNSELFGGEMLIANVGAYAGLIKIMPNLEGKYTLAPNMFLLRTNQNLKYLFYLLSSPSCAEQLKMMAVSSAQPKLNKDNIRRVKVVIPSPKEQTQIANYLNHKTEQLDSLIAKKEQLIQLLQEERTAMINQAVTKGLDPNVPMNDSGIEWLGEIPAHWEVRPLKNFVQCNSETLKDSTNPELEIEYIEIGDVDYEKGIQNTSTYLFSKAPSRARRVVRHGDIIISTVRTYLKAITSIDSRLDGFVASTGFAVLKPIGIKSSFLGCIAKTEGFIGEIISMSRGVSYPSITAQDLINIKIPFTNIKEQIEIAEFVNIENNRITEIINIAKNEIQLLKEYKIALISEVVTGKVDVSEEILN